MNKENLKKDFILFRDNLKKYRDVVQKIWRADNYREKETIPKLIEEEETPLRECLVEDWGRIEDYYRKMGVSLVGGAYGRSFPIFDTAFDEQLFENPAKGSALQMASQMATKAVGMLEALEEEDVHRLDRKLPVVFVAHRFGEENKKLIDTVFKFLETQDVAITSGSEVDTDSISEKVKRKIEDADFVIGIMTKDERDEKGEWTAAKWVREELAYALGKKDVVRLIEEGNDIEGRLFGDREYILFSRENLTSALIDLAQVLKSKGI